MSAKPELDIINAEIETLKSTFDVYKVYLEQKFRSLQGDAIEPEYIRKILDAAAENKEKFRALEKEYRKNRGKEQIDQNFIDKTSMIIDTLDNIENECYSALIAYNNQQYKLYIHSIKKGVIPALTPLSYSI